MSSSIKKIAAVGAVVLLAGCNIKFWEQSPTQSVVNPSQQPTIEEPTTVTTQSVSIPLPPMSPDEIELGEPQAGSSTPTLSTVVESEGDLKYENPQYSFGLTFPGLWGAVVERPMVVPADTKFVASVYLRSRLDLDRYVQVNIVKTEDVKDPSVVDYPHVKVRQTKTYTYFMSTGGDNVGKPETEAEKFEMIEEESVAIRKSFRLLVK